MFLNHNEHGKGWHPSIVNCQKMTISEKPSFRLTRDQPVNLSLKTIRSQKLFQNASWFIRQICCIEKDEVINLFITQKSDMIIIKFWTFSLLLFFLVMKSDEKVIQKLRQLSHE